ncbi:MAG: ATP-binding cassette domain-containing protein [Candidatus Binatia bacterium]|nr:ATP-binding cassette domain-containing protein [Candidatus Binatia bacterium]
MLEVEGLGHSYGDTRALDGLTFDVGRGEIFGLLGPNGGGKTTLFRILTTLLNPSDGRARIGGHDVVGDPQAVRRQIGVVFQSPSLDVKLSVHENMVHQGHLHGLHGADLGARINEMLGRVSMTERAADMVETLSGGMRRRVDLAKGLMHQPDLVLLDEPTTGLDPGARRDLWNYVTNARDRDGLSALITTHLMGDAERCDRLLIIDHGKIVALGTPDSLRESVGGDVIVARTPDPATLAAEIGQKLDQSAEVVDDTVRIRRSRGHEFVPLLFETFPGRIEALSVGKPTLEDVFIQHTGHRLWEESDDTEA